jgi:hypothetical protein
MRSSLHIASSFDAAWRQIILPWCKTASNVALKSRTCTAVLTPSPTHASFLRARLLEEDISLIGVRFLTPQKIREHLVRQIGQRVPLREHLRLLLSIAADESLRLPPNAEARSARMREPDYLAAKSVARAPDHFLRLIDQFSTAGLDFVAEGPPVLSGVIEKFHRHLAACNFQLIYETDRNLLKMVEDQPPQFSDLLVTGFNGAHWPLWFLLQAAVQASQNCTVILDYPREQARNADELWIGTWEEHLDAAKPVDEPEGPETRPEDEQSRFFLVGLNATEQAQAVAAIALSFLDEKSCTRLGILFPGPGALPRIVSDLLTKSNIPHHDTIGHFVPGSFEDPVWNAWLELQEDHRLDPLLRFFKALPSRGDVLGDLSIETLEACLRRVHRDILIDDIDVLREHCARRADDAELGPILRALSKIEFLRPKASFVRFLAETKGIFAQWKWKERWFEVERLSQDWRGAVHNEFPRSLFLRWLKEILSSFAPARTPEGDHPYSRVHLLSYADAEGKEWSHLICAGLNQGEWPRVHNESGILRDDKIASFNKRAIRQGRQGEGHSTVREGKTLLLGAQEQRQIAARQFFSVLESATYKVAFTANLLHESAPERLWNPSELLSRTYFSSRKTVLSQDTMQQLREQTQAWLNQQTLFQARSESTPEIRQTRVAYDARRRVDQPAGEYDFALREPIDRPITLRATQWDKVVKYPALIWLREFLGVENSERELNQWSAATGIWVHQWLAQLAQAPARNQFVEFPTPEEIRERVRQAARRLQEAIVDLCFSCGRTLPDWWISGWSNALALADCLASKLGQVGEWADVATEWILDSPQIVSLGENEKLRFRGRIDLILARSRVGEANLGQSEIWIVDFKTGNYKPLLGSSSKSAEPRATSLRKKLIRGDAVQLGLYGLAARELGAGTIGLSLLSPRTNLDQPQLDLAEIAEHSDFWSALYHMQETGVFGLLGPIRSDFGFAADYPLATIPIDEEVLREKWAITHPALIDDEEDRQ